MQNTVSIVWLPSKTTQLSNLAEPLEDEYLVWLPSKTTQLSNIHLCALCDAFSLVTI